jgi:hypothetical protein
VRECRRGGFNHAVRVCVVCVPPGQEPLHRPATVTQCSALWPPAPAAQAQHICATYNHAHPQAPSSRKHSDTHKSRRHAREWEMMQGPRTLPDHLEETNTARTGTCLSCFMVLPRGSNQPHMQVTHTHKQLTRARCWPPWPGPTYAPATIYAALWVAAAARRVARWAPHSEAGAGEWPAGNAPRHRARASALPAAASRTP